MQYDTVVIGAGQAGLAAGYHLARRGRSFVILEADSRVGGSWLHRWDSMRLFTPAAHDGLPGLPYPRTSGFPSRDELTEYLSGYAARFALPVQTGVQVDSLVRHGTGFRVTSGDTSYEADNVILATGAHRRPRTPAFAPELRDDIVQFHSADYRNPAQLPPGTVLLVGAGNSAADIALELAPTHRVLLSGRHPGHLPLDITSRQARIMFPLILFAGSHLLTEQTGPGRKARARMLSGHGDPLIRVKPADLEAAGVERVGRIAGISDGLPQSEEGDRFDVAAVVWCTGFSAGTEWIDLPGLDSSGRLATTRGAVVGQPGLFVLGQPFQHRYSSHTLTGVGLDSADVVKQIARRLPRATAPVPTGAASVTA